MRYIERLFWRTPLNPRRRKIKNALKDLWAPVALPNADRQSEGALYEMFLGYDNQDIHKCHHYFNFYERHFSALRGKPIKLLEIGVFNGGSLRMWRQYFGGDATIVGIDIDERCKKYDGEHGAVRIGDQTDTEFLQKVVDEFGAFDIIIDDGGHNPYHQLASFCFLYPRMADDGLYYCEDTMVNYWPKRQDLGGRFTFVNVAHEIADRLTEPNFQRKDWNRYATVPSERSGKIVVPAVIAMTKGVHFYDSIVVFERGQRFEPYHETR